MSTFHNQPVVEDIVSAFETSQNQPWSVFNDKLGSIPIKDYKKKDVFKSENPIELSDADIPVFGLVPRLEKLVLVSCDTCAMVVKKDCLHYHYNRHHSNPENNTFTLEQFMLPSIKSNKFKKQKVNPRNVRGKKVLDNENVEPVVQEIKSEFVLQEVKSEFNDEEIKSEFDMLENKSEFSIQEIKSEFGKLEYNRLLETNQVEIKTENEDQYDDECGVNVTIQSCNPITDTDVFDWNPKPCDPSLINYTDYNINDRMTVSAVSSKNEEQPSNTFLDNKSDKTIINSIFSSTSVLTESLDFKKEKISNTPTIDSSSIMSSGEDNKTNIYPENEYFQSNSELQINEDQTNGTPSNNFLDVMSNKCLDVSYNHQSESFIPVDNKRETKPMPIVDFSGLVNDEAFIKSRYDGGIKYYQLTNKLLKNEQTKCSSNNKYFSMKNNTNLDSPNTSYRQSSIASKNTQKQIKLSLNNDSSKSRNNASFDNFKNKLSFDSQHDEQLNFNLINKYTFATKNTSINNSKNENIPSSSELSNFTPNTKHSNITSLNNTDNNLTGFNELSNISMVVKEKMIHNLVNSYSDRNNKSSDNNITNCDQSSNDLINVQKESNSKIIVVHPCDVNKDKEHLSKSGNDNYKISSKFDDEITTASLTPKIPHPNVITENNKNKNKSALKLLDNKEQTQFKSNETHCYPIINTTMSSVKLKETKKAPNNAYSYLMDNENSCDSDSSYDDSYASCDDSAPDYNQTLVESLKYKKIKKPIVVIDYMDVIIGSNKRINVSKNEYHQFSDFDDNKTQTKLGYSYKYLDACDESSNDTITSCDQSLGGQENIKSISRNTFSNLSDNSSDYSMTNSDQSSIKSGCIVKKTKYTQTDKILNYINVKKNKDPITRVDESVAETLINDATKSTQTDISLDCMDCFAMSEVFVKSCISVNSSTHNAENSGINCIPIDSSSQITKYPISTPVSSNTEVINKIFDSPSENLESHRAEDQNHISNCSHNSSSFQQFSQSPENQNDNLSNCLSYGSINENNHLDDKCNSEIYDDEPIENEFNINLDPIIESSYLDLNHVICKSRFNNVIDEQINYGQICKRIPYKYGNIEGRAKKYVKRRLGEHVANGKENRNRWITGYGNFKKVKRVKFVMKKVARSDDSDNNDNADE